jgi:hypothetical protein
MKMNQPRLLMIAIDPPSDTHCFTNESQCSKLKERQVTDFKTEMYCTVFGESDPQCRRLRECLQAEIQHLRTRL